MQQSVCVSLANNFGTTGNSLEKLVNLDMNPTPFTNIYLKCITELNVKYKTIKLLIHNIIENLHDLDYGIDFV